MSSCSLFKTFTKKEIKRKELKMGTEARMVKEKNESRIKPL